MSFKIGSNHAPYSDPSSKRETEGPTSMVLNPDVRNRLMNLMNIEQFDRLYARLEPQPSAESAFREARARQLNGRAQPQNPNDG